MNPFTKLYTALKRATTGDDVTWEEYFDVLNLMIGLIAGTNENLLKGFIKVQSGEVEDGVYDMMGIPESQQPSKNDAAGQSGRESSQRSSSERSSRERTSRARSNR